MCNISAISQPIIMKLGIHIMYGYTVTDKYFQNFRSKVKVAERLKTLFGHISGTNGRRDSGLVSKCRGMSQPTWWHGGRGLPSLIALLCIGMLHVEKVNCHIGCVIISVVSATWWSAEHTGKITLQ